MVRVRGTITFEFDSNGSASQTSNSIEVGGERNRWSPPLVPPLHTKGTRSYREYLIEIDGDDAVDTFRWSVDGGANFNESDVPVNGTTYALSAGVEIEFNSTRCL